MSNPLSQVSLEHVFKTLAANFHSIDTAQAFEKLLQGLVENLTDSSEHAEIMQAMPSPQGYDEYLYGFSNYNNERGRIELTFLVSHRLMQDSSRLVNARCQLFLNPSPILARPSEALVQSLLPTLKELSMDQPVATELGGFAGNIGDNLVGVCAGSNGPPPDVSCHLTARDQLSAGELKMLFPRI